MAHINLRKGSQFTFQSIDENLVITGGSGIRSAGRKHFTTGVVISGSYMGAGHNNQYAHLRVGCCDVGEPPEGRTVTEHQRSPLVVFSNVNDTTSSYNHPDPHAQATANGGRTDFSDYNLCLHNSSSTQYSFSGLCFSSDAVLDGGSDNNTRYSAIGAAIKAVRTTTAGSKNKNTDLIFAVSSSYSGAGSNYPDFPGDGLHHRLSIFGNGQMRFGHHNVDYNDVGDEFHEDFHFFGARASGDIAAFTNLNTSGNSSDLLMLNIVGDGAQGTGNVYIRFRFGGSNVAYIRNTGAAMVLEDLSDERQKTNIVDNTSSLSNLLNVKVRSFEWTSSHARGAYGTSSFTGFIAQELYEHFPDCVSTNEERNEAKGVSPGDPNYEYWTVSQTSLIPHLVNSIQEQNKLINALETRIAALENA